MLQLLFLNIIDKQTLATEVHLGSSDGVQTGFPAPFKRVKIPEGMASFTHKRVWQTLLGWQQCQKCEGIQNNLTIFPYHFVIDLQKLIWYCWPNSCKIVKDYFRYKYK